MTVTYDAAKRLTNQHAVVSGEINGLEVRVLPGSPLIFNELAASEFSLTKNCAQFCATPGANPCPWGRPRLGFSRGVEPSTQNLLQKGRPIL